jgi:integrase/recombinase XerC
MSGLTPADFRAFLARRAMDGRERTTIARGLSVLRGCVRFLERRKLAISA